MAIVLSDLRFEASVHLVLSDPFISFLVAIVLSDLRFVASVYLVRIVWPLYCLTFDLLLLFISSVS